MMRTPLVRTALGSALLLAVVAGCSEVAEPKDVGPENIPAIALTPGQFVFAVTARKWSFDNTYQPENFYSIDSRGGVDVGMAVAGYSGGSGLVTVTDGDNVVVFAQTLAENLPDGTHLAVSGKLPFKVHVEANNYTGIVSLSVTATAGI
jgi:hypothetical protein